MGYILGMQRWFSTCKSMNIVWHINKTKDRIISLDAEKAFDEIRHLFMIKALKKFGIEGTNLNIIKAIKDKSTANTIIHGKKLSNMTRMTTLTTFIQHCIGSPRYSN